MIARASLNGEKVLFMDQSVCGLVSVVWWVLECWVPLLEEGSAVLLCAHLGKCGCLSHWKGKQNSLTWCEITCTTRFCSAVFCMCLCEEQMCLQGGFLC